MTTPIKRLECHELYYLGYHIRKISQKSMSPFLRNRIERKDRTLLASHNPFGDTICNIMCLWKGTNKTQVVWHKDNTLIKYSIGRKVLCGVTSYEIMKNAI